MSLGLTWAVTLACNAVLGIDDATLCRGESCDAGGPGMSEQVAPNSPGSSNAARDAGLDAAAGLDRELTPPVQGLSGAANGPISGDESTNGGASGSAGAGNSGGDDPSGGRGNSVGGNPGNDNPGNDNPGNDNPGNDNPGSDNPGSDNPGNDNPGNAGPSNGSSGSGNSGNGPGGNNPGNSSGNGNSGPGDDDGDDDVDDDVQASPCAGRAAGSAFCDGVTRISCGPAGAVAGTLACPSAEHCAQSSGAGCATCLTGEARCTGASLSVCNAEHTGFEAVACAGPAQCNAALARCDAAACSANQLRCEGAVLQVCNTTLTGFDPVIDCGTAAACNAQTGDCNVCSPGTRRCIDPNTVGICDSSGQSEAAIDCTPLIESCVAGECELLGL